MEADSNERASKVHSASGDYVEPGSSQPSEETETSSFRETEMISQQSSPRVSVVTKEDDAGSVSEVENGNPVVGKSLSEFQSDCDSDLEDDDSDTSSVASSEVDNRVEEVLEREQFLKNKKLETRGSTSNLDTGSGNIPRRQVYRIPEGDLGDDENAETQLFHPASLLVQVIGFQVRLIVRVVGIVIWLTNICFSLITRPITMTLQAKDTVTNMATGVRDQGFGLFSSAREGASQTMSTLSRLTTKTVWGCLLVTYLIFMLGLLLIPAMFLDLLVVNSFVEEPVYIHQVLDFDYSQPQPVAVVPLFSPKELESINKLSPDKVVSTRIIPAHHMFHITVSLTLPESEYNMNLGMFQLTAELLSARNQVLLRSSKPCRLRFSSFPARIAKTALYSVPLLMGIYTEAQNLEIRVLEAQEKVIPTASVRLLLEPKAGYDKGGGVPELYKADIVLQSTLPWPKAVLRNWKWTIYLCVGVWLFLFEVSFVLCCCPQLLIPSLRGKKDDEKVTVEAEVKNRRPLSEKNSQRKARIRRRVNFEKSVTKAADAGDGHSNSTAETRATDLSMPPLEEVLESTEVEEEEIEETMKTLGDALVEGVAEGLKQAKTVTP